MWHVTCKKGMDTKGVQQSISVKWFLGTLKCLFCDAVHIKFYTESTMYPEYGLKTRIQHSP